MSQHKHLRFTKDHEWVRMNGPIAEVGITSHAQEALGDIVYVELPSVGTTYKRHAVFGVVESVKTTSDLFCPLSGEVVEVNAELATKAETINEDCYGAGWMIRVKISDPAELSGLLNADQYEALLSEGEES